MVEIQYDQHFLKDKAVAEVIFTAAELQKDDVVLEIGPGYGILTKEMAARVKKVIAVEIDKQFAELFEKNSTIEFILGDIMEVLHLRTDFNKIVSNIPYQICEPLMHYLCLAKQVTLSVLMVPTKFALRVQQHPIFSAFLTLKIIEEVAGEVFSPSPKVTSAIVKITARKEDRDDLFVIRKLYWQRTKKLKNGLRDTLVDFYERKGKKLSKKEALLLMGKMVISDILLETSIAKMPLERYGEMAKKVEELI